MRHASKNNIDTCYYQARRNTPGIKAMVDYLGIDRAVAVKLKKVLTGETDLLTIDSAAKRHWEAHNPHEPVTLALEAVNELLGGYGVEYVESTEDTMHEAQGIEYINFGDTYSPTLMYDHRDGIWRLGTFGDCVEMEEKRFAA